MSSKPIRKPSEKTVYFACLAVVLILIAGMGLHGLVSGQVQNARIHTELSMSLGDQSVDALPSGVYITSVFTNLKNNVSYSPLQIFSISVLSTGVLVFSLVYLLVILISRVKNYSNLILGAVVFLIVRMFSVDIAVTVEALFGGPFNTTLAIIFYGATLDACFLLCLTVEEQTAGRIRPARVAILAAYYAAVLAAIAIVSKNSQTLYLEQHIRLGLYYPLAYMYYRLYRLVKAKTPHIRPALVGYAAIFTGLFADTMYLSGWATADMYMLYPATLCLLLMCMIYIYYQRVIEVRQQEATRLANLYKEMEQKSADMMVSQLQPHFMFNTLQAIQVLARRDTRLADKVIFTFSNYLRSNLDFVKINQPVPFDKALVPVQCYVDIEKIRFKNRFDAVYDIEASDFTVPPLCIQPLVENAVKHGVCRKPEGGTVTLSTRELPDCYEVTITDDGVGFDPESLRDKKDGGIYNARFQLTHMLGAELMIESVPGQGTVQRVRIPRKE
ncbi:histidine kinase [Eubacterium sp. 1001713B170207_170306_E7]|uniref:sensor histidine kinase n=1 Tax=Eubacterium sp. 1001713B170207_170306_E7 TaxID=2787097 RepID=UPI001899C1A2|nr:histidine kinase [Eubacterium sp. 1001713B170207_170306_E7]